MSVRLSGTWTRTDANGQAISNVTMYWGWTTGKYPFTNAVTDNPSLTNAAGNWTDQAGATQADTATADPFEFTTRRGRCALEK